MDDRNYYIRRAEAELHMAQSATVPEAVIAHHRLASLSLERVYGAPIDAEARPATA